jgi:hypothetical protein
MLYQVDSSCITLASGPAGKFFYRVRGEIKSIDDLTQIQLTTQQEEL